MHSVIGRAAYALNADRHPLWLDVMAIALGQALNLVPTAGWGAELQISFDPAMIEMKPGIEEVAGLYTVRIINGTDQELNLERVSASCGCVGHHLAATRLPPRGETELVLTYAFRGIVGPQRKTVTVTTRMAGQPAVDHRLTIQGEVPTALRVDRRALIWRAGEAPDAKALTIFVKDEYDVSDIGVRLSGPSPDIDVVGVYDKVARCFTISVTPDQTRFVAAAGQDAQAQYDLTVRYTLPSGVIREEPLFVILHAVSRSPRAPVP